LGPKFLAVSSSHESMDSMPVILQTFGTLQTLLLTHNCELKQMTYCRNGGSGAVITYFFVK